MHCGICPSGLGLVAACLRKNLWKNFTLAAGYTVERDADLKHVTVRITFFSQFFFFLVYLKIR